MWVCDTQMDSLIFPSAQTEITPFPFQEKSHTHLLKNNKSLNAKKQEYLQQHPHLLLLFNFKVRQ